MIGPSRPLLAFAAIAALGGCAMLGGGKDDGQSSAERGSVAIDKKAEASQIGVNAYLWRASLDTIAFMPLSSADAFGGVIITDWFADPNAPTERFKATVYILDTRLRADAVKVTLNKQVRSSAGWLDAEVDPETMIQMENAILTRARQLRLATER